MLYRDTREFRSQSNVRDMEQLRRWLRGEAGEEVLRKWLEGLWGSSP